MLICSVIFLLLTAVSMYFISFGDKLKLGVAIGLMTLSAGVVCFLVTGFWLPRAFAFTAACFVNMGVCMIGEGFWNWKKEKVITVSVIISLAVAALVLFL